MNRKEIQFTFCLFCFAIVVGCTDSSPEFENAKKLDIQQLKQDKSSNVVASTEEFETRIKTLTAKARQLESNLKYNEAVDVWQQAYELFAANTGKNSWQAINAREICKLARTKADFSVGQQNALRELETLKSSFDSILKSNDHQQIYRMANQILSFQQQLFGRDSLAVAQTLVQVAMIEEKIGKFDEAIRHFHLAVKTFKELGISHSPEVELAHTGLAASYMRQQKYLPALTNQKLATGIASEIWGEASIQYADQANQLGVLYHRAGNLEMAIRVLGAAEAIRRRTLGANDPRVAHSLMNMGVVAQDAKRYELAEKSLAFALKIFENNEEVDPELIFRCKSQLATLFMSSSRPAEAEPLLASLVVILESKSNVPVQRVSDYRYRLGIALARQGKYDRAQPLLEKTLTMQKRLLGETHKDTIRTMKAYALLLKQTKQQNAAEKVKSEIQQVTYESETNDFVPRK